MKTAQIVPGSTQPVCVEIDVTNDQVDEPDEDFCVQLTSDNPDVDFGSDACHICVTIKDPVNEGNRLCAMFLCIIYSHINCDCLQRAH